VRFGRRHIQPQRRVIQRAGLIHPMTLLNRVQNRKQRCLRECSPLTPNARAPIAFDLPLTPSQLDTDSPSTESMGFFLRRLVSRW